MRCLNSNSRRSTNFIIAIVLIVRPDNPLCKKTIQSMNVIWSVDNIFIILSIVWCELTLKGPSMEFLDAIIGSEQIFFQPCFSYKLSHSFTAFLWSSSPSGNSESASQFLLTFLGNGFVGNSAGCSFVASISSFWRTCYCLVFFGRPPFSAFDEFTYFDLFYTFSCWPLWCFTKWWQRWHFSFRPLWCWEYFSVFSILVNFFPSNL